MSRVWQTTFGKQRTNLANGAKIWQISAHKFNVIFAVLVDEIELHFFRWTLCAGVFSLGKKSLVTSIPRGKLAYKQPSLQKMLNLFQFWYKVSKLIQ